MYDNYFSMENLKNSGKKIEFYMSTGMYHKTTHHADESAGFNKGTVVVFFFLYLSFIIISCLGLVHAFQDRKY